MASLKEKAYSIIREKIVSCELKPGDIIDEKSLIAQTECGRTPVREALNILAQDGLVRIVPRRGMFVSEVSVKDICDIYELKQGIEPIIIRTYGNRIPVEKLQEFQRIFESDMDAYAYTLQDDAFHSMIIDACDNRYYRQVMGVVSDQSQRVRMLTNEAPGRQAQSTREHLDVIQALLQQDAESAAEAMRKHYVNSLEDLMRFNMVNEFLKV